MKTGILITTLVILITVPSFAQSSKPESADKILKSAIEEANKSNKNVFVFFHATWCGWCKRLEKAITSDELKNIINENYVVAHVDVHERGEKIEQFENPGGNELMKKFGGDNSGLPFYVFLDSKGNKICDSNVMSNNSNIGYPGAPEEIDAFLNLIKKSTNNINSDNLDTIAKYFKDNAPKPRG